jgi:hypothetical protein
VRIDPFLSLCTKVKSKWIKVPHIKPETLKLLGEKVGKSLDGNLPSKNPKEDSHTNIILPLTRKMRRSNNHYSLKSLNIYGLSSPIKKDID